LSDRWTQTDVDERLKEVRNELLQFLGERTRLDWFKQKVRWRKSRQYVWPGAPDGLASLLDEAVESDAGVSAFVEHILQRQTAIANSIDRYNTTLRHFMEQECGKPVADFPPDLKQRFTQARITFQGTRDELLRLARDTAAGRDIDWKELLSMRLAMLNEDARLQIFREVCALVADEVELANPDMRPEQRGVFARTLQVKLQWQDRRHVAPLLAETYNEARRILDFDTLFANYETLRRKASEAGPGDPFDVELLATTRAVLLSMIELIEQLFPKAAGTHEREMNSLRVAV